MIGSIKKRTLAVIAAIFIMFAIVMITAPESHAAEEKMIKAVPVVSEQTAGVRADVEKDWRITVDKSGYVALGPVGANVNSYTYYLKVYSSSGKSMYSGYEYLSSTRNKMTYVGLKKGTYIVRVKTSDPTYTLYYLKYTPSISSRGSSQKSAKKLKKGSTKKGVVYLNNYSKKYYYKIVNTKKRNVTLKLNFSMGEGGSSYSGIRIKFYAKGQTKRAQQRTVGYTSTNGKLKLYTLGYGNKLAKGTYYLVVYGYKHGNGYYQIKW
jgi:hypothetical protein